MTPTPTDTPPEAAALDLEHQVKLARCQAQLLRHGGVGEHARMPTKPEQQAAKDIDALADTIELLAARHHAEPQGSRAGADGGEGAA